MTPRQAQLLQFLRDYMRIHDGVSPSFDEISAAFNLKSKSGAHRMLSLLEQQGRIKRQHRGVRSIEIIDLGPPTVDALREMVQRLVDEEGPTRAIAALVDLAQEIAPRAGAA